MERSSQLAVLSQNHYLVLQRLLTDFEPIFCIHLVFHVSQLKLFKAGSEIHVEKLPASNLEGIYCATQKCFALPRSGVGFYFLGWHYPG